MFKVNPDVYLSLLYKDKFGVPIYTCKVNFGNKKITDYDIELIDYDNLSGLSNVEIVLHKGYDTKDYYCYFDLKHKNNSYSVRFSLTFSNFILLFNNLSFEKGICKSKLIFNAHSLAETDKSNLLIPLLEGFNDYDNYISELNKVKKSVEVKSKTTKITKKKVKPFTFYKDSIGDTYCILGVVSRYIKNSVGTKKAVREYAVLKNIFDIDNYTLNDFNEIKLTDIIFKNKIDLYEELRTFSELPLIDFIDYYNLNHSLLNKDYFSKVLGDRLNNDFYRYKLSNNFKSFMHNQAIPLFLKDIKLENGENEYITNEILINSYLMSLSLTGSFKASLLNNNEDFLSNYFNEKIKESYSGVSSDVFNYESKYQVPYARYCYEKFLEGIVEFENENTIYLTNKDINTDNYFYKASLYKDLDVNVIYDNLLFYLEEKRFVITYYIDDTGYRNYHSSSISYKYHKNKSNGLANENHIKNKYYFDNATYTFLDIYSITDDFESEKLIESFKYNRY